MVLLWKQCMGFICYFQFLDRFLVVNNGRKCEIRYYEYTGSTFRNISLTFLPSLGTFLTFHHNHLLLLMKKATKLDMWKQMEVCNSDLWGTFQKVPELEKIPLDAIKRIRSLKLHKICKMGRHEGVGRVLLPSSGINNNNLITVEMSGSNVCEETLSYWNEKN